MIGGGPAGSVAAAQLARDGFETVLLEKARFPRPNVGESLIPHFWKYTDLIGATPSIEEEGFIRKGGGLALWNGTMRQLRFSEFGYKRPALHVERDRFDELLMQAAARRGAAVFQETQVTRIDDSGSDVTVHYRAGGEGGQIRSRYVVDASGQSAVLSRQLGIRQFDPDIRFTSLWGYYTGGRYLTIDGQVMPFEDRRRTPPATLVSSLGDWGWIWHIVMKETVSIGIILPPERLQAFKRGDDSLESRFQRIVEGSTLTGQLMEGAEFKGTLFGIKDYAYVPTELAIGRCYLAGDAAAFVDPINSAGVVFGMYAGFLAATSIAGSLRNAASEDRYRAMYQKLYGDRLALFRLLALPSDSVGVESAIQNALSVVGGVAESEQRLMLLQATLNVRSSGIHTALERLGLPSDIAVTTVPVPTL